MKTKKEETKDSKETRFQCPACNDKRNTMVSAAVISPWVLELAQKSSPSTTSFQQCPNCFSSWFSVFYDDSILRALYSDYRGLLYFSVRNSWEPTYTENLNKGLDSSEEWMRTRKLQILESLSKAGIRTDVMTSVLDFGGGHGGIIPDFSERYLLEANENIAPPKGITHIKSLDEVIGKELDLVMCCGVLEHVNSPFNLVKEIFSVKSNYYLFEIPTGNPSVRTGLANYEAVLRYVARNKAIWRTIQILERKVHRKFRKFFPLRCSEHIQFISKEGLRMLLERAGFEVLALEETNPNTNLTDGQNLGFDTGLLAICKRVI
jgi:hypothetical protein